MNRDLDTFEDHGAWYTKGKEINLNAFNDGVVHTVLITTTESLGII